MRAAYCVIFCTEKGTPLDPDNLVKREFDAALKEEDVGLGARILMAPVLPWAKSKAADGVSAACRIEVFRLISESQAGWTAEDRRRLFAPYKAKIEAQVTGGMTHVIEKEMGRIISVLATELGQTYLSLFH